MVDLLLIVIFDALLEKYYFQGNHDMVVELDSSTEGKMLARYHTWFLYNDSFLYLLNIRHAPEHGYYFTQRHRGCAGDSL